MDSQTQYSFSLVIYFILKPEKQHLNIYKDINTYINWRNKIFKYLISVFLSCMHACIINLFFLWELLKTARAALRLTEITEYNNNSIPETPPSTTQFIHTHH